LPLLFRHPTIATLAAEVEAAKLAADGWAKRLEAEIDQMSDEEVARLLADEEARNASP
jgi:2-oxo-4-hydroxy-4-carboxy--5-ureidoimidazoline (OHCU) decarboxylase